MTQAATNRVKVFLITVLLIATPQIEYPVPEKSLAVQGLQDSKGSWPGNFATTRSPQTLCQSASAKIVAAVLLSRGEDTVAARPRRIGWNPYFGMVISGILT